MTSAQVLDKRAVLMPSSTSMPLSSIAARWILANMLPQVLLVVAAGVFLSVNGISFAGLISSSNAEKFANAGWILVAAAGVYLVLSVWARGAVLRPLVPRFSVLGWLPNGLLSGAAMLLAAVGGGLVGVGMAKALAMSGNYVSPAPSGFALAPWVLGQIIAAELLGLILGGLPGLILGTGEALAACRGTRRTAAWILWTAAAWTAIASVVALHALLIVSFPALPAAAMAALAVAAPILIGLAAALLTLPAVAKLARRQNGVD